MNKYLVKIKTKFNFIELLVDDVNSPEMKEILEQPYVEEVYIETTEHYKDNERALKNVRKFNSETNNSLFKKE